MEGYLQQLKLGPDAWSVKRGTFNDIMKKAAGALKPFLMNQKNIAGLGNIYVDEILFHAGLHPTGKAQNLTAQERDDLYSTMQSVLRTAVHCHADPDSFPDSYLLPRREKNAECPRCGNTIQKISVGGRSAYVCPSCQHAP
jgi:formamidopyrimidine-DNA glycosylase